MQIRNDVFQFSHPFVMVEMLENKTFYCFLQHSFFESISPMQFEILATVLYFCLVFNYNRNLYQQTINYYVTRQHLLNSILRNCNFILDFFCLYFLHILFLVDVKNFSLKWKYIAGILLFIQPNHVDGITFGALHKHLEMLKQYGQGRNGLKKYWKLSPLRPSLWTVPW